MKRTKKNYETHLNALYADMYSESQAEDEFAYLTNKSRGKATNLKAINSACINHILGSLLRKFDPIAFNAGYNDWSR
jgi:hypothetical protein